jgi:hypothetical protein
VLKLRQLRNFIESTLILSRYEQLKQLVTRLVIRKESTMVNGWQVESKLVSDRINDCHWF